MYSFPYFKEKDGAAVMDFIKQNPIAMLVGVSADHRPVATQIPFLFKQRDGDLYLQGHIMRQTDHHKAFETNKNALAIFTGPHAYVSASWYQDQKQASTWNYMTVHAKGELCFLNEERLLVMLEELTTHFEQNPSSPSLYKELPADYVAKLAKAIVAFEIRVTSIDHVFKLSQNRDEKSFETITEQLDKSDAQARQIAAEMMKRKNKLFAP